MASVSKDSRSLWRIQYVDPNGDRRTLRLGKVNKATAEQISRHIDNMVVHVASRGTLERQTALWLAEIGDKLYNKLAKAGLVEAKAPVELEPESEPESSMALAAFLQDHIDHGRTAHGKAASESTLAAWRSTQRFLNDQLPRRTLNSITAEDAHQFRVWMDKRKIRQTTSPRKGEPMAENGKRKHISAAKMFFNAAKRRGLIESNPFEAQVSGSQANRSRDHYITPEDAAKVLEAAPDTPWRLTFALWRLAGLRKMEIFNLKWRDVQWDQGKMLVRPTKTERIEGCDIRFVPLRDVREHLEDAFQAALPSGKQSVPADDPIITRFSTTNSNLDKPFRKIVEAAGLVPWPKLFQNLRASCETQWLKEGERADLVANWIGHSVTVQRKNYVQHTADDIESFNAKPAFKSGALCGAVGTDTEGNREEMVRHKPDENTETQCFHWSRVGVEGLEPEASFPGDSAADSNLGANRMHSAELGTCWARLRMLIANCTDLPTEVRQSLIAEGDSAAQAEL